MIFTINNHFLVSYASIGFLIEFYCELNKVNILCGQYRLSLAADLRNYSNLHVATSDTIRERTGGEKRYWADKIMYLHVVDEFEP
jgi:hypothetical protein